MSVYLKILTGPGTGQVLPVPNSQPVTLGRSASASYAFDDPLLSRRHCAVESRSQLCRIVDLQSRNGTFVNGQRVGASMLNLGDRIKIGNLVIEVCSARTSPSQPLPSFQGGGTPALTQGISSCQACQATLEGDARELKGRVLCPVCFDRYDIDEDMVEGFKISERREVTSFGVSYLAQQLLMERTVILKAIQMGPETDQISLKRFMREAKTGGRLTHPNIVELYDVNEENGLLYIVTEFVEGDNLGKIVQTHQAPLPCPDVTKVMYQIAQALHYAHSQSIVHRDVKPANVLIRRVDRVAKLQGFTLSKSLDRAGMSVITADGESLGTPYYMPPEQVRSAKSVDQRSDIYSWAATTYHCLSGRLPQEAHSYGEFIDKVFSQDPPSLNRVTSGLPQPLVNLIASCLKRDQSARPASMATVIRELEAIIPLLQ